MVELGTIIAGKYLLDRVIGHGGMGLVVQATHLQLHQPVAIKLLLPHAVQDGTTVQRFLREARAAVRLRGEHVARVLDVGTLDTGTPYMVLEYLEGTDLEHFPRAQLTIGALVDLLLQACEALAEAHALGIVHRDIKPSNFFVSRDPGGALFLKLIDFGISKIPGATDKLTESQVVLGTPAYMSPEQIRASRQVDPRSDIWSVGVVLHELIDGALPFEADAFSAMILKIVNEPPARLTAHVPAGLDGVIRRCLEKDPARRFQSVAELAAALAAYAGSPAQAAITVERTRALAPGPRRGAAGAADASHADAAPVSPPTVQWRVRTRRWQRSLITAAAIGAGVGAGLFTVRGGSPAASLPAPTATPAPDAAPPVIAPPPLAPDAPTTTAPAKPAASPSAATGEPGSAAAPTAPAGEPGGPAAVSSDRHAPVPAGSGRPPEVPARHLHHPAPAPSRRPPARTETPRDSSPPTTPPRRFDPGD